MSSPVPPPLPQTPPPLPRQSAAPEGIRAIYYDGVQAQQRTVWLRQVTTPEGPALELTLPSGLRRLWWLSELRALRGAHRSDELTLFRARPEELPEDAPPDAVAAPEDPARIVLRAEGDPARQALIDALRRGKERYKRARPKRGLWRLTSRLALALSAVAFILLLAIPQLADALAARFPREAEVRFGQIVVDELRDYMASEEPEGGSGLFCEAPAGQAALAKMVARLHEGEPSGYPLSVVVVDHDTINAFAAPGGQIVILRGLIDEAGSPEELAGVLAHEIGHVAARDPMRLALRGGGSAGIISILLGDMAGGLAAGLLGERLLSAAYTRQAEAAADDFGLNLLAEARIDAAGFAHFFERDSDEGSAFDYSSSHPQNHARATAAREAEASQPPPVPLLSAREWRALRQICAG